MLTRVAWFLSRDGRRVESSGTLEGISYVAFQNPVTDAMTAMLAVVSFSRSRRVCRSNILSFALQVRRIVKPVRTNCNKRPGMVPY